MKEKKDCKIIQDLLPNHIEHLTNEDTNKYIEEHIAECEKCRKMFDNMKKELKVNNADREKREVKYIKKFSNKMKILKLILAFILIIFIVFIGTKFVIIKSMQRKIMKYKDITNFHTQITTYRGDSIEFGNIYHKDGKHLTHIKSSNEKDIREMINTSNGNTYITSKNDKIAVLNGFTLGVSDKVYNYLETESIKEFIINLFRSHISTVKCNDKKCYKIDNFKSPDVLYPEQGICVYIDKETGLLVRVEQGEQIGSNIFTTVKDYTYEFNKVTDDDLKEPDINEYTVQ